MGRILKWVAIILGVLLLAVVAVVFVFGVFRFGGMPMMAARGFRAPFGYGGYRFLFWPLLLGRLLIPLAFVALLVLLGFAIGRAASRPRMQVVDHAPVASAAGAASVSTSSCPNCGRPVQADWNNCPYCGTNLRPPEPPVQGENG
jgi:hypothetical protein